MTIQRFEDPEVRINAMKLCVKIRERINTTSTGNNTQSEIKYLVQVIPFVFFGKASKFTNN